MKIKPIKMNNINHCIYKIFNDGYIKSIHILCPFTQFLDHKKLHILIDECFKSEIDILIYIKPEFWIRDMINQQNFEIIFEELRKDKNKYRKITRDEIKNYDRERMASILFNAINYGVIYDWMDFDFIVGFLDIKNSTDLLSRSKVEDFRDIQNEFFYKLSNSISTILVCNNKICIACSKSNCCTGFVDKFIGDNIMFYFLKNKSDQAPIENIVMNKVLVLIHEFKNILIEQEKNNKKLNLGLRFGLAKSTKPIILSTLGISRDKNGNLEQKLTTDYTLTGDDVNLAARIVNLTTESMIAHATKEKNELDKYRNIMYNLDNVNSSEISKRMENLNIHIDDIFQVSDVDFSVRVNEAFYKGLSESISSLDWKDVFFIPKGFNTREKIYILGGNDIVCLDQHKKDYVLL